MLERPYIEALMSQLPSHVIKKIELSVAISFFIGQFIYG
jgi:hypothetical protein